MNLFDLYAKISLDDKEYNGSLDKAGKNTAAFAEKLKSGLAAAGKIAAVGVGAASAAIAALGKIGLDYNTEMETYATNFTVMLGDAQAAASKVEELKKFAASTPFSMGDLSGATQTLLAFNVSAEESTGVLQKLGDISLGDAGKLTSLTRAYGKMSSSQKVNLENIQIMVEAGYNPLLNIQERTGESMEELYDRISKGGVAFEELQQAMTDATSQGGQFYQGMEQASKTTAGLLSTLKDNARALVGEVFQPVSTGLTAGLLPAAISAIEKLTATFREEGIDGMIKAAGAIVADAVAAFADRLPMFLDTAMAIVDSLISGIEDNLPAITESAWETLITFIEGMSKTIPKLASLALDVVMHLADYLLNNLPRIIAAAVDLFAGFIQAIVGKLPELIPLAWKLVVNLAEAIVRNVPKIVSAAADIGDAITDGIWNGILSGWDWLKSKVKNIARDLLNAAKDALGIHSPSRLFRDMVGKNISLGLAEGIEAGAGSVYSAMDDLTDGLTPDISAELSAPGVRAAAPSAQGSPAVYITINGAKYSDEQALAAAVAQELQYLFNRRAAANA